jgi:hypothetical protein
LKPAAGDVGVAGGRIRRARISRMICCVSTKASSPWISTQWAPFCRVSLSYGTVIQSAGTESRHAQRSLRIPRHSAKAGIRQLPLRSLHNHVCTFFNLGPTRLTESERRTRVQPVLLGNTGLGVEAQVVLEIYIWVLCDQNHVTGEFGRRIRFLHFW